MHEIEPSQHSWFLWLLCVWLEHQGGLPWGPSPLPGQVTPTSMGSLAFLSWGRSGEHLVQNYLVTYQLTG